MLQFIRERATGWIAWAIIILICIPFALWGINQYFTPDQGLVVARVNDAEIGYYQFRSAYQQQREQLRRMLGGQIPASMLEDGRLREETLQRLVNDEILVQTALGNGLRVGDAQLASAITTLPAFQSNGSFSQPLYDQFLRSRATSAQGFELDLRRSMLSEQLITALRRSAFATRTEIDHALRMLGEERTFRTLRVEAGSVPRLEPPESEIRAWYDEHRDQYVQPERVKVRYIELSRDDIAKGVPLDDAELRAMYEQNKANYRTAEQREARHILIAVPRDADEATVDAARAKIAALRARIVGGEDFAVVAREASEDPGSAPAGGGLGSFGRGVMDPAFEDAAFGLAQGQLSEPVRSAFGWHLIEVTAIQPERERAFEDVRDDLMREYRRAQAEQIFAERAERLATLSFEHPESLEVAAEALDLKPVTSDFFSRDGQGASGIATQANVRQAAFSTDVLDGGNNSDLLELGPSRVAVVRVAEREPSRPRTLDEVRGDIAGKLASEAAATAVAEVGKRVLEALTAGKPADEVASQEGLTWSEARTIARDTTGDPSPEVKQALFRMPAPDAGQARFQGVSLAGGGYVVVALEAVGQRAPDEQRDRELRRRLAEAIASDHGAAEFSAVMRALRGGADVQVFDQNLRPEEG